STPSRSPTVRPRAPGPGRGCWARPNTSEACRAAWHSPLSLAQIGEQRRHFGGEALDLGEPLFVGADEVEDHVARTRVVELGDTGGDVGRPAERTVALRGLAEVHGVARAQALGGGLERVLVSAVDAREQQMRRDEAALEHAVRRLSGGGD